MKKKLLFYLLLFITGIAQAQTLFWEDDLEGAGGPNLGGGTRTPSLTFSSGGPPATRYFFRTPLSGISTSFAVTGIQGTNVWAAEDVDNGNLQTAHQNVTWTGINISGRTNLQFRGLFGTGGATGAFDNTAVSGNGTDYLIVEYSIDGGPYTSAVRFMPISTVASTLLGLETTGDSIGDGTTLSNTMAEFTYNIPTTGTTLSLRMKLFANSLVEEMIIDDFRLYESPACSNPTITTPPSNANVCVNGNTSFSIVASGATSYQWQVNTGSGFNNVTNGGVYSGATTATLTITGATAGMNGYLYRCIAMQSPCSTTSTQATLTVSNPTISPLSQTNVACNGGANGAASVNAAGGGISPYTYNWTPGNPTGDGTVSVTGLTAGTWTCTVTDNIGCSATATFNITQPTAITLNALSQTNISCFGGANGAACVSAASGGAGGYTYNWTPGNPTGDGTTCVTGLTAGTWTCTVTDANSCTAARTFNITSPAAITVTAASQTNISCNGGSNGAASINTPTGGAGGYTYNWTPGNPTGDGTVSVTGLTAGSWTCTVTDINSCTATQTFNITQPTALVLTAASQTNVSCNGGSNGAASVNAATGGAGGYTYNWTPGNPTGDGTVSVTGLTAGSWTCTVTDANSCTAAQTFNITAPTAISVTAASQTNVSCNGGSNGAASINTPTGGAGGYTYNWTPGNPTGDGTVSVTGLTAGSWTCTVTDANSCTAALTFNITAPTAISVTAASQTNISCNGGSNGAASINTPTGGAGGYSYNWTPGNPTGDGTVSVTGLTAGSWTCTVTDANSCTAAQTFNITQPTALVLTAASQTNVSCNGGSNGAASVNAATGGAGGYTYNWTPGNPTGDGTVSVTGLTAGSWTCTVTDANSCTAAQTFNITAPTAISVTAASQTNVSCNGGSNGAASINTPTGGAGGYTYNWTPGNPTGDGTVSVTGLTAGTWTCTVTDANSCTAAQTFNITAPTAISVTAASQTNVSCNGGSNGAASINTPTGGAGGYTYNWTPGNPTGDGTVSVTGLTAGSWTCTVTDANSCTATQTFNITAPTAISLNALSQTNVSCFGGSNGAACVSAATGGAGGYTYNWTPGNPTGDGTTCVTGLTAGSWTCTVTDANSCTATRTFNITSPTALAVTPASQTNVSCNGGSNGAASINTPTGGAGGYTYNWTPGNPTGDGTVSVTGLTAGSWTCTVTDANSCTVTQTFNITAPTAITANIASTPTSCSANTGTATVSSVSGGAGGYTYSWAPSGGTAATASNLGAGTYTCTITDANSCTITRTVTVSTVAGPTLTAASQTNVSCNGGSNGAASVNAATGGTSPYTYNWTPGNPTGDGTVSVTGLTAGSWTCTVTDASGCTASVTFNITQPPALTITVSSQTNINCNGNCNGAATVSVTGGTPTYTYAWAPGNGTAPTASGLCAGTYTCTVTDANGCTATRTVTITQPTAVALTAASQTNVACNGGATGAASVNAASGGTGSYTYNWTPGNPTGDGTTSVTGLTAGTWTCTATDANGCTATQTFNITQPTAITITASASPATICNGGSTGLTASASGGAGSFTYLWMPGSLAGASQTVSPTSTTTYTVVATDANSCASPSATVTVTVNTTPVVTLSGTNHFCAGGSTTLTGSSGGTSQWYLNGVAIPGATSNTYVATAAGVYNMIKTNTNGCFDSASVGITVTVDPLPVIDSTATTDALCNGTSDGTASVFVSSGTPSYSYNWTPSGGNAATASGLAAGTYYCTVTDANGCTDTDSVIVAQPSVLLVTVTGTNVNCNGDTSGTATATVSGGTPGYSYSWAPSGGSNAMATGLGAGTYTCSVTDLNGCMTTETVTIVEPALLTAVASGQDATCNGAADGSVSVTAAGGNGSYTYLWMPGGLTTATITGMTAGCYTCTITDANGCSTTASFCITEPSAVSATINFVSNPTACGATDGAIAINVTGGTPGYSYLWSDSSTTANLVSIGAGSYTCTVTDTNGCTGTVSATLVDPAGVPATLSLAFDTACVDDAAFTLSGGSPAGGNWSGNGVTGNMFNAALAGPGAHAIYYTYLDSSGCTSIASDTIWVDICMNIITPASNGVVRIYPNPNNGSFSLNSSFGGTFELTDNLGQVILRRQIVAGTTSISDETLANGIYFVRLTDETDTVHVARIIIQK